MADIFALKATSPGPMRVDGTAVGVLDKVVLTGVSPATADVLLYRLPAGLEVFELAVITDDLDSGTAILFGVGYRPCKTGSALAANATYFAAAGQTTAQAGGRLECVFKPIKFDEDVYVTITVGTGGAGSNTGKEVHVVAQGNQVGTP